MSDSTLRQHQNNRNRSRRRLHPKTAFDLFSHFTTLNALSFITTNPSFNHNVRSFISTYADLESYEIDGFRVWLTLLVNRRNGVVFPLYLVEEDLLLHRRPNPNYFCFHCLCAGWGNHFVSKRRYHMIVPDEGSWGNCLREDALNVAQHLLHGMIHCNGFGHLLSMNGVDSSRAFLSREEIMELFDVMCRLLKTRKVTVRDVLRKGQMELRLLHNITYGKSWYEEWGYKFCKGSFGVNEQMYNSSAKLLTSLGISKVLSDLSGDEILRKIIHHYMDECETKPTTIGELLDFMLGCKSGTRPLPKSKPVSCTGPKVTVENEVTCKRVKVSSPKKSSLSKCSKLSLWAERLDCRYPKRRLQSAAQTVVNILKGGLMEGIKCAQVGRHELREIMRQHIGDTGLIDFVLKSINNVLVGDTIVRRTYNAGTKKFEFAVVPLKEHKTPTSLTKNRDKTAFPPLPQPCFSVLSSLSEPVLPYLDVMPTVDVLDDISYIYQCVLKGYKQSDPVAMALRAIIDTKLFVKEWKLEDGVKDSMLTWVVCRVLPSYDELRRFLTRPLPPGEIIEVPSGIETEDLKTRLQCALQDTYCITEKFVVEEVVEYEKENADQLCVQVWVKGSGLDLETTLRYEAGPCNWKVSCHKCGANDEDGEDMVYCTGCEALMHTRCTGVGNMDQNDNFRCSKCRKLR